MFACLLVATWEADLESKIRKTKLHRTLKLTKAHMHYVQDGSIDIGGKKLK